MPVIIQHVILIPIELHGQLVDLLSRVMSMEQCDKCTLHLWSKEKDALFLIAQLGFADEYIEHVKEVRSFDGSCYGKAIGSGENFMVCDTGDDIAILPQKPFIEIAGFRAVKCTPIFSAEGQRLGVISTHFKDPKWTWNLTALAGLKDELSSLLSKIADSALSKVTAN